jgi:hypothetical protein
MMRIRFLPEDDAERTLTRLLAQPLLRLLLPLVILLLYLALPLYLWGLGANGAQAVIDDGASIELYSAQLSSANRATPNLNTSIATGHAVMTLIGDTLYYRVFVKDIDDITLAHIHDGVPGRNSPIVHDLYTGQGPFDPTHPIRGAITLSPTDISKLRAGNYYVNVRTTEYTGGEIRGQLVREPLPTEFNALLLGRNEVAPPVETVASGVANFTLIPTGAYTLTYQIHVADISAITAAHIHLGPAGLNGPVLYHLYTGNGAFDSTTPLSGTVNLAPQDILDLLTDYLYINIHTETHPTGEIRGQLRGPH